MQVIFNADDFGRSASVNAAVIQAHKRGVLTSASLMVAGEAVDEAVEMARETPTLAVGLHVVVTNGRAIRPPGEIPHLVDAAGSFSNDPVRAGLCYFFSQKARRELSRELEGQFERFAATGLPLSHVDGHLHMHLHPSVLQILIPLAQEYGACGLRLPRDNLWLSLRHEQRGAGAKILWALVFGLLSRWGLSKLSGSFFVIARRVYGLMQSGRMEEAYVIELLRHLKVETAEIYFHPATRPSGNALGPNPGDLASLLSPAVRRVLEERRIVRSTYPALKRGGAYP